VLSSDWQRSPNYPPLRGAVPDRQGKYVEAEPLYQRALAIYKQQLGLSHPSTKLVEQNYALFLQDFSPRNEQH
jgi:hypothetical protein